MGAAKGFKGPYGGWEVANDNDLMSLSNDYRHGVNFCTLGPHYDKAYFLNSSLENFSVLIKLEGQSELT